MGNKIKIPSDWERRRELLNILVTTFNLDWHLKHLCCRVYLFDSNSSSSLVMEILDICNGHWRIIWIHIHVYSLVIMLEYGWVPEVRESYRFMSKVKPLLFQRSWYQILFQTRWCWTLDQVNKYLANYYYSALCRKALLAIVYCTRSNKFFLLYWCNTNWHFLASYNSFYF